jgi:crossover junction endodeoxyribonuclease RusA
VTTPVILLPWPPASLSGHNTGHWRGKAGIVAKHRLWARNAVLAAKITVAGDGDVPVEIRFVPPDRRGDRTNYPNRVKPVFDGLADALKINDRRFLPSFVFAPPEKPGRLEVRIGFPA